ncbi:hypothetical protein KSS87_022620 [Heliosperma pusillum]|nr:hypothetical protein KSS87_022620 [Heliosperma pusillum]
MMELNLKDTAINMLHLVAMPYPGRGHINPLLNLCKLLVRTKPDLLITFVVTEEWLGLLASEPQLSPNIRLSAIPQVIPSEFDRAAGFVDFIEAVNTKLQDPFEHLLDRLHPSPTAIIYDSYLSWVVDVGILRNIPLAAFFTVSASFITVFFHFDLLLQHGHFPLDVSERGHEVVDYIPGLAPTTIADMPTIFHGTGSITYTRVLDSISALKKTQYALFSSIYEFEGPVLDCLRAKLGIPLYHIGPMIPYFDLKPNTMIYKSDYFQWLDAQPKDSVLYISQGSFLSLSSAQANEFVEGIKESGVRFLWVTRGDSSQFTDGIGETGLLVPWCDQLKVLCHPSVGGFWTHCGWNSTCEGIYAGVPMLTCPMFWDQIPNSKVIVNDMKIGLRAMNPEKVLSRLQVAQLVKKFMDPGSDERREMVERAKKLSHTFRIAVAEGDRRLVSPVSIMELNLTETQITGRHLMAMPYPGRGHINPLLNLCKLLAQTKPDLLITFVVTEEWLGILSSEPQLLPPNIRLSAIPQVIPSEVDRAADFIGFIEAINTKLQDPFEQLLDRLQQPPTAIIYDSYLSWPVDVGTQRNIPMVSFLTMSASCITVFFHFDLLLKHGHFPLDVFERGHEVVDYIPGLAPTTIADLTTIFHGNGSITYPRTLDSMSALKKAQYALFSSIYEFEGPVLDCLKAKLGIPLYHIGPMIPYFDLKPNTMIYKSDYFQWLDTQPKDSVLYISHGSYLSVSSAQAKEFAEGIKESGVRFLWVTRGVSSQLTDGISETGFLVPWCDQLKVLCHPSVGGFWTHGGWNSTCEGIYAGVPMLTCPIFWDQVPNSKLIVNDMKIGLRVMKNGVKPEVLSRQQVAELVKKFMDPESDKRKEMVERAKKLSNIFRIAVAKGGSAASDLESFINSI